LGVVPTAPEPPILLLPLSWLTDLGSGEIILDRPGDERGRRAEHRDRRAAVWDRRRRRGARGQRLRDEQRRSRRHGRPEAVQRIPVGNGPYGVA
jgi:hypothetical protein